MQASQAGSYTTSNRCCDTVAAHSSELLCTDTQSTGPLTPGCHAEGTLPCRLKHTLVVPVAETLTAPASSTTAVPVADPGHSSFLATCPSLSPHTDHLLCGCARHSATAGHYQHQHQTGGVVWRLSGCCDGLQQRPNTRGIPGKCCRPQPRLQSHQLLPGSGLSYQDKPPKVPAS